MQKVIVALLLVVFGICTITLYLMWRSQGQMIIVPAMIEMEDAMVHDLKSRMTDQMTNQNWPLN